jgi:hypothetical protein
MMMMMMKVNNNNDDDETRKSSNTGLAATKSDVGDEAAPLANGAAAAASGTGWGN